MNKHTPGPWHIGPFEGHVSGKDDRLVAGCMGLFDSKNDTRDENIANSHLIAAAPDLLDALRAIQSQCAGHVDEFSQRVWTLAETAITKAEGREL